MMAKQLLALSVRRMTSPWRTVLGVLLIVALRPSATAVAAELVWQTLEPGLELGRATVSDAESVATPAINILRIDPSRFELGLFNASARGNVSKTPKQWSEAEDLVAVINASMFQEDLLTSVSMMHTGNHINNRYRSKDKAMLVFDPIRPGISPVRILDKQCDDLDQEIQAYATVIQSIRMISCTRKNVWRPQVKKWSTAAIGQDSGGRLLFIQTETAFSTHDLINELLALPLQITRAMYVEGGPQAQLYINSQGKTFEFAGQITPLFSGPGRLAWPVPNVVGIRRQTRSLD